MFEFKRKIKFLKSQKGQGTELISVYIPPGANVNETSAKLRDEYGQAMNIKSKPTRKNVQSAIEKIVHILKGVNKAPENGVAIFAGSVDGKIESFEIIPPQPVQISVYRCDSTFFTGPLEYLFDVHDVYGLVAMDRREATIGTLKGKAVKIIKKLKSNVPGKHHKGGQSARRFERIIEDAAEKFFGKIGRKCNEIFLSTEVKGVLVGGSGPTKHMFVKGSHLDNNVKKKILGIIDTGYTDETGIKEIVDGSKDILEHAELAEEKELVDKFLKESVTGGLATYGINEIKQALTRGQVDILLLSEELEDKVVDELIAMAEKEGGKVEMISTETQEGNQFYIAFGGMGALLRYK